MYTSVTVLPTSDFPDVKIIKSYIVLISLSHNFTLEGVKWTNFEIRKSSEMLYGALKFDPLYLQNIETCSWNILKKAFTQK